MDANDPSAAWAEFARLLELPLHGLREVTELRQTLLHLERSFVLVARANRSSWREIGDALGISRQSANARHRLSVSRADGDCPRSGADGAASSDGY